MIENDTSVETDEALRRIYGDAAQFSRVEKFILVHLDSPTSEVIAERVETFDPNDFFFDSCPLCVSAREDGGHIVFESGDESATASPVDASDEKPLDSL